jgi:hypothetical protein
MLLILAKDFPTFHSHVLHFSRGLETFGIYIFEFSTFSVLQLDSHNFECDMQRDSRKECHVNAKKNVLSLQTISQRKAQSLCQLPCSLGSLERKNSHQFCLIIEVKTHGLSLITCIDLDLYLSFFITILHS